MTDLMLYTSKQCSGKLVALGHRARFQGHGAIGRQVARTQRSRRNKCIEARATVVRERVAPSEHPVLQPLQVLPRGISQAKPPLRHTEVEVHLSMQYNCAFGTRLAVIGSQQGWQTSSAAPMTWQPGDNWNAVLTLPVGSDVEYKYIVIDESGSVIRWQEGSNLKLSLRNPGYVIHVSDSWAQDQRQVHEIGVPAEAAAAAPSPRSSDERLQAAAESAAAAPSPRSSSSSGSSWECPPAAAESAAAAPSARSSSSSSSGSSWERPPAAAESPAAAPSPRSNGSSSGSSSSWDRPPAVAESAGANRGHGSSSSNGHSSSSSNGQSSSSSNGRSSSSNKLQNNIAAFSWPAAVRGTSATPTAAPAAAAAELSGPLETQQQQQQQDPSTKSPAADLQHSHRSTRANTGVSSSHVQQKQHPLLQQVQQQQQQLAVPSDLAVDVSDLLSLLQQELSSALDALSSCPAAEPDFTAENLMSEGRAVLDLLQSQATVASSSSSSDRKIVVKDTGSTGAVKVSSSNSVTTGRSGSNDTSRATCVASSSSSSSRVTRGPRNPGSCSGSGLASEDAIAAALLSDDCEEACFCLVDAICNCMGSEAGMEECCDVVYDASNNKVSDILQQQQQQQQQGVTVLAAGADLESYSSSTNNVAPAVAVKSAPVDAAVTAECSTSEPAEAAAAAAAATAPATESIVAAAAAVAPEEPVTAEELAATAQWSVAAAAAAFPVDAEARAAAFAGVQRALDRSAVLLDRLSDPSHPMLLAADREVAVAKQQLGQLLPA